MTIWQRFKDDWPTKLLLMIGGLHVGLYWSEKLLS